MPGPGVARPYPPQCGMNYPVRRKNRANPASRRDIRNEVNREPAERCRDSARQID
jgi:hypothetical protein